jgi:hypothetical protein
MLTQEQATKLITAMMGKCWHEWNEYAPKKARASRVVKCKLCGEQQANKTRWFPCDSQGRMTYEVIDFMQDNLSEIWTSYLNNAMFDGDCLRHDWLNIILSLANLARYLKEHEEWAYEDKAWQLLKEWEG